MKDYRRRKGRIIREKMEDFIRRKEWLLGKKGRNVGEGTAEKEGLLWNERKDCTRIKGRIVLE